MQPPRNPRSRSQGENWTVPPADSLSASPLGVSRLLCAASRFFSPTSASRRPCPVLSAVRWTASHLCCVCAGTLGQARDRKSQEEERLGDQQETEPRAAREGDQKAGNDVPSRSSRARLTGLGGRSEWRRILPPFHPRLGQANPEAAAGWAVTQQAHTQHAAERQGQARQEAHRARQSDGSGPRAGVPGT